MFPWRSKLGNLELPNHPGPKTLQCSKTIAAHSMPVVMCILSAGLQPRAQNKENGSVDEKKLHRSQSVNSAQAKALTGIFKSVGSTWKYGEADVQSLAESGTGIPNSILTLIKQAEAAQNKLLKEAGSFIKSWKSDKDDERLVMLKKCSSRTSQNLASLQYLRDFHELPCDVALTKPNLAS